MPDEGSNLVQRLHEQAINHLRKEAGLPPAQPQTPVRIDLPDAPPGSPVAAEWNLYRHEVGRLLAEGSRGRVALVKVGQPITVWDTTPRCRPGQSAALRARTLPSPGDSTCLAGTQPRIQ